MAVGIERDADRAVPEPLADDLRVDARFKRARAKAALLGPIASWKQTCGKDGLRFAQGKKCDGRMEARDLPARLVTERRTYAPRSPSSVSLRAAGGSAARSTQGGACFEPRRDAPNSSKATGTRPLAQAVRRPTHPRPRIERERTPGSSVRSLLLRAPRAPRAASAGCYRALSGSSTGVSPTASTFLRSSSKPNSQRYEAGSVRASRLGPRLVSGRPARRCR